MTDTVEYKQICSSDFDTYMFEVVKIDEPLMFDIETIGLYGKIRLVQFYQKHFDEVLIVEYPCVENIVNLLNSCWVVCHNASYDISTIQDNLEEKSWQPKVLDDTLYLSRLHFFSEDRFSLDDCINYAIGYNPYENKKNLQLSDWSIPQLSEEQKLYASYDVYYLYKLWEVVHKQKDTYSYKLDIQTLKSNLNFQCNGLPVDKDKVYERLNLNTKRLEEINLPVNCNSYPQVRLYIGSCFSDDEGLARLSLEGNDKAKKVRQARKIIKENSFLRKYLADDDGHIYGKFAPNARSGRSTCQHQNLQQLPRATKECFGVKAEDNLVLVYSDFSQLELRCICAITGDEAMAEMYYKGKDIHTFTAQMLYGTEKPTNEERRIAKCCNFGLLYGAGAPTLRKLLLTTSGIDISIDEATKIKKKWLNLWLKVKDWQRRGINAWKKDVAWRTPLGRRYKAKMMTDQLNIQVQGMGAEVAKLANMYINKNLNLSDNEDWRKWQRNFIHDSYLFVVPNEFIVYEELAHIIANAMQKSWQEVSAACRIKDLPMPVEVKVGYNWGDIESDSCKSIYKYKQ